MTILKFGILLNNNSFFPPNESTLQSSTATELGVGQTTLLFTSREDKSYKGSLCQLPKGGDLTIIFFFSTLYQKDLHYNLFHLSCQTAPSFYIFLPASIIQGCKNNF